MSTDSITIAPSMRALANLTQAQAALDRVTEVAHLAGAEAHGWARVSLYCTSAEAVDAIAAEWGVTPRWGADGPYVAEVGEGAAAAEAVFYGKRPAQAASAA